MNTKILSIIIGMWLCILALPCVGDNSLWEAFRDTSSVEAAHALLKGMPSKNILRLCRDYGVLVDSGVEPAEAPVIPMAISVLKERQELSQETFLAILSDATEPTYWRSLCAEFSVDAGFFAPLEQLSIEAAFHSLIGILNDTSAPLALRETAAVAVGKLLRDGYFWIYCSSVGKNPVLDKDDVPKIRSEQGPAFVKHDLRVKHFFDSLMGGISEKVQVRGISWVWRIADVRGEKTPMIHEMQQFLEIKSTGEISKQVKQRYHFAKTRLDRHIRQ